MERKCDNFFDCDDGSDEKDCNILIVDKNSYRKEYPPITRRGLKLNVQVSVSILSMGEFKDISMSYRAKFELTSKWFDKRLLYSNLKNDIYKNTIGKEEMAMIWTPPIIFNNTLEVETSRQNGFSKIFIDKQGKHFVPPPSIIDETFHYTGSDNALYLLAEYDLVLYCKFELECYPFDTQMCTIEVN